MSERTGVVMMLFGAAVALVGLIWLVLGDFDAGVQATAPLTAASSDTVVTTAEATPTTAAAALSTTTRPPTTTTARPTTTTAPPVTSTTVAAETVAEFLARFRRALDDDDLEFLFERLHPIAKDAFGEELCRGFVGREIAVLDNYQATEEPGQPRQQSILGTTVQLYEVPVEFDFQGQHFETVGTFALVDGLVHYFAECR